MNKIMKRIAALAAAGCLTIGAAMADLPTFDEIASWTEQDRIYVYNLIGRANYYLMRDDTSEYVDFDQLGRTHPLYAGDRTSWGYGGDREGDETCFLFVGAYAGEDQLKEIGVPDYRISNDPNMMVFKCTINYVSDNLDHYLRMNYSDFDVFSADGARIGDTEFASGLNYIAEVYAGANGDLFIVVPDAPKGCQLRFKFTADRAMWLSSSEKPAAVESKAQ